MKYFKVSYRYQEASLGVDTILSTVVSAYDFNHASTSSLNFPWFGNPTVTIISVEKL